MDYQVAQGKSIIQESKIGHDFRTGGISLLFSPCRLEQYWPIVGLCEFINAEDVR